MKIESECVLVSFITTICVLGMMHKEQNMLMQIEVQIMEKN